MSRVFEVIVVAATLGLVGCASTSSYVYMPYPRPTSQVDGYPAASYLVPSGRPTGSVRVAAFGIASLTSDTGSEVPALQVRLVVVNNTSARPWTIDTRTVLATLDGEGTSGPAFVNTDAGMPPLITIPAGTQGTVDLYYPAPPGMERSDRLPAMWIAWQIDYGSGPTSQRAVFTSVRVDADDYGDRYVYGPYADAYPYGYYPVAFGFGLGPYWWYDPVYPYHAFYHHAVFVVPGGVWVGGRFSVGFYGRGYGAHAFGGRYHGGYRGGGHFGGGRAGGGHRGGGHR